MDDINRPQPQLPRRDYTQPARPQAPRPLNQVPQPQPAPIVSTQRQDYDYRHASQTQPATHPPIAKRRAALASPKILTAAAAAAVLLIAGGLFLAKPAKQVGATAGQLAEQSNFSFYYPQPLPSGYSYVNDINAFQGGQAYFMLAKGAKHIIIHEQPIGSKTGGDPLLAPQSLSSPIGKVTLGSSVDQPGAEISANNTFILINTTGSVPKTDLVDTINSLKIIK
jgi:hypothetical protein